MRTANEVLCTEDAAVYMVNIKGWACVNCKRYWGEDERMARWCCANDFPCECGGRNKNKSYTVCETCREKVEAERYGARPRVDWDGDSPLCSHDRFFFSEEEFIDWVVDNRYDPETGTSLGPLTAEDVEDLRLEICEENHPRPFELCDWLSDYLPEDGDGEPPAGWQEAEKAVNDWLEKARPLSWTPGPNVPTTSSILAIFEWVQWAD